MPLLVVALFKDSRLKEGSRMSELKRAKKAYDQVASVKELENYKINIRKMPMMIQVNGLAQTVSFYQTKRDAHKEILGHLYEYIKEEELVDIKQYKNLVELVVNLDSTDYRIITSEIMAYLQWLKRFADGREK